MGRGVPGKVAAFISGEEASVLNLVVVCFYVGAGHLTLRVLVESSEALHLNFIDILAKELNNSPAVNQHLTHFQCITTMLSSETAIVWE